MSFTSNIDSKVIYGYKDIDLILGRIKSDLQIVQSKKKADNKNIEYVNIPAAFDIEDSSFYQSNKKVGIMYEWTLGLNGLIIIGREWKEFIYVIDRMVEFLKLSKSKRLIIYTHYLQHEFEYMRKWLLWEKVFASEPRKPIYALTQSGIEFRCSYMLSGYSLEKIGEQLHEYQVKKLVGQLDYSKIRHSKTSLTESEIAYCVNDVKVVMCYIAEKMSQDGDITKIPLTKTGYVRNYCREKCFKSSDYKTFIHSLTLGPEEYNQLKRAFQGGFTHANPFISNLQEPIKNVTSYDITSSYP